MASLAVCRKLVLGLCVARASIRYGLLGLVLRVLLLDAIFRSGVVYLLVPYLRNDSYIDTVRFSE